MRTIPRLALWLAAATLLQGCFPHVRNTQEVRHFHFPSSSVPWQTLSNGKDLYWYYQGYRSADDSKALCTNMHLLVRERGVKPDWRKIAGSFESSWSVGEFRQFEPILSAHHGTTRRVLGTSAHFGQTEIHILSPADPGPDGPPRRPAGVDSLDVWHNTLCRAGQPIPRLVVEDGRGLWIFADLDRSCGAGNADWRAPADLMAFDAAGRFDALLRTPMQLYYLDRDKREEAEFQMPRMASSDPSLLAHRSRAVIAIDQVPLPHGKVFTLEQGRMTGTLHTAPLANTRCRYSETSVFLTPFEDTPNPELDDCAPFPDR